MKINVLPVLVTMAKGIGNGFPLAAVVTTKGEWEGYAQMMYTMGIMYTRYLG